MKKSIEIGTCYRDSMVCWSRWRVDRLGVNFLGIPHAVVVSLSDSTVSRTIACQTLSDRRRFLRIDSDQVRRRTSPAFAVDTAASGKHGPQGHERLGVAA